MENGLIKMMEQKGHQMSIIEEESYTNYYLLLSNGGTINFLKDKNKFFSQVHFKKIFLRFFSEEEINEMLSYIRDDKPLLVSFSNITGVELKDYVPVGKIEKTLKYFDVRMEKGCNLVSKEDKKELLFQYREYNDFDYSFHLNGINMKVYFEVEQHNVVLIVESSTEKERTEMKINTKEKMKEALFAFIQKAEQKNRIKNVMKPSQFFFHWWLSENNLEDDHKEIYEVLLKTISPVEIEKICATVLKNFYEDKVIVMNENPLHVWVFENDEKTHQRIKTQLLQLKEEKLDRRLQNILQKEGVK